MSGFSIGKIREHIPVLILEQSGTLATEQEVFPIVRKKSQELEEEVLQADLLQLWQSLLHHSLK